MTEACREHKWVVCLAYSADGSDARGGFTLTELLVVVVIIGTLAAIAIPNYIGQPKEARDPAAMAQLLTAATSQQLYHARQDAFVASARDLEAFGFRQGGQRIPVMAASASTYCIQSPGGNDTFKITQDTGRPVSGAC